MVLLYLLGLLRKSNVVSRQPHKEQESHILEMKQAELSGKVWELTPSPDEVSEFAYFPVESSLSVSLEGFRPEARMVVR